QRIASVSDACARLAGAPKGGTVLGLLGYLLSDIGALECRLQVALARHLPRALRRGAWVVALDITLIPYHGQPFADPAEIYRGQAPADGQLRGLRAIRATHPTGVATYSWAPHGPGRRRVTVALCVCRRRRRDRRGHGCFLYACGRVRATPAWVKTLYRRRFGIETSYRQMNRARIRTTTRRPALRLLFVGVALLLRNLWAWLHWTALARRRRGGRRVQLERLTFATMLLWLAHLAESAFGYRD